MQNRIPVTELLNSISEIIDQAKQNSTATFDEFAYIFATSKSESYIRDKLAIQLQKRHINLIIAREFLHKSERQKSNIRHDIGVLERVSGKDARPLQIIELKNWYCHDVRQKKVWDAIQTDMKRIDEIFAEMHGVESIIIVCFTHVMNKVTDLHDGIIKYQDDINYDLQRKNPLKYPEDITSYFKSKLKNTNYTLNFSLEDRYSPKGKYLNREIRNYFYVISKKK
ncbi:hypothetical protein [Cohnella mopanensis]|uniref:hypothetical protein n=1 Tax=Cohnella mopanensis TaxID=2911966 RepID=UPI001EF7E5C0|nr:hypothetical protein [Cohnella mopanensis]